ncbi:hypothetical protein [Alicyclobacillus mengziensis]|uniref:Uncharacterized protein n=1 Tax=Alicyclobacillus mengziensis TaxID=2931921 RepID=A0A9X7W492_9BACL|nr:hypothetical protein [Alicyclobacillus mengziensis]QSO50130.1 hypothetical protein JZ786_24500 [Alicyclobacillus mengziensis]
MWLKNRYTYINDDTIEVEINSKNPKTIRIVIGQKYVVRPANPNNLRHRGRECTAIAFNGSGVKVKFLDTKRYTRVQLDDLDVE